MSQQVLDALKARFGDAIVETASAFGDESAVVKPSHWKEVCRFLRDDPSMRFDMFIDLCGVDYPDREPRMEVVLHLYSLPLAHRIRLKARVGDEELETVELDTVTDIWTGANWFERECYDLLGVVFKGHPDLRRILMYEGFEGHPLRRDYPANKTQPLLPYRTEGEAGQPLEKLAPFGADEGMPFGRHGAPNVRDTRGDI